MPAETYVYSGQWRKAKNVYIMDSGVWRDCKEVWTKDAGVWRLVFVRTPVFALAASGNNYVLSTAALNAGWDGVTPVEIDVSVSTNIGSDSISSIDWNAYLANYPDVAAAAVGWTLGPISYAQWHYAKGGQLEGRTLTYIQPAPAFDTGFFPPGSIINLTVNPGCGIVGSGGPGGYGGLYDDSHRAVDAPTPGSTGGVAIKARVPMTIYNNGIIGGGGGGGGGGAGAPPSQGFDDPGTGGGGGAGITQGPGGLSWRAGTFTGQPGTIGKGGAAGTLSNQGSKEWAQATAGGVGGGMGFAGVASLASAGGPGLPGGPPGASIDGSSLITWQVYGDVRGPLI